MFFTLPSKIASMSDISTPCTSSNPRQSHNLNFKGRLLDIIVYMLNWKQIRHDDLWNELRKHSPNIHLQKLKDPKGVNRARRSEDKQCNVQTKNDKQWCTKHYTETKDLATRTLIKTEGDLSCSGRVSSNKCHSM